MSGHSHWAGIKHKKGAADQKRGQIFSKLLNAVSVAARTEANPQFNMKLKAAIDRAKEYKVPQENIDRAVRRATEDKNLEEVVCEAYGPEGTAILIEAISDNKNRTIPEIKKILSDHEAKWAESGSVRWAFELVADNRGSRADSRGEDSGGRWQAKFPQAISAQGKAKLENLIEDLLDHDDIQEVYTNTQ